jgi:hypothetical protein
MILLTRSRICSSNLAGSPFSSLLLFWICRRKSIFFLLARKCISSSATTIIVSVSSYPNSHDWNKKHLTSQDPVTVCWMLLQYIGLDIKMENIWLQTSGLTCSSAQVMVFWVVMSCTDIVGYQYFGGLCYWYPTRPLHRVTMQKTMT